MLEAQHVAGQKRTTVLESRAEALKTEVKAAKQQAVTTSAAPPPSV
jgi:hypothetical protein